MRLLLDTHALLWFCEGNDALSATARAAIEDSANERFVSHATPWEVAIKMAIGKLDVQSGYAAIFPGVLDANGFKLLPSSLDHYCGVIVLPKHHSDPFDRLMIVQAVTEGLTIVTCDSQFAAYGVPLLW